MLHRKWFLESKYIFWAHDTREAAETIKLFEAYHEYRKENIKDTTKKARLMGINIRYRTTPNIYYKVNTLKTAEMIKLFGA